MGSGRGYLAAWLMAAAGVIGTASDADAQPDRRVRLGIAVTTVASNPVFAGLGPTVSWAVSRQAELFGSVTVGRRGAFAVGRGEFGARVLNATPRVGRSAWYLFAGLAGVTGPRGGGFLVGGVGVETGNRSRWFGELGFGGGVRFSAGVRARLMRRAA